MYLYYKLNQISKKVEDTSTKEFGIYFMIFISNKLQGISRNITKIRKIILSFKRGSKRSCCLFYSHFKYINSIG